MAEATSRDIAPSSGVNLLSKWRMAQAIIADQTCSAADIRVMLRILDHHNCQTGRCDPSVETVMRATGMGRRTVITAIRRAGSEGLHLC